MSETTCGGCGTTYKVDMKFCAYCGRAIIKVEDQARIDKVVEQVREVKKRKETHRIRDQNLVIDAINYAHPGLGNSLTSMNNLELQRQVSEVQSKYTPFNLDEMGLRNFHEYVDEGMVKVHKIDGSSHMVPGGPRTHTLDFQIENSHLLKELLSRRDEVTLEFRKDEFTKIKASGVIRNRSYNGETSMVEIEFLVDEFEEMPIEETKHIVTTIRKPDKFTCENCGSTRLECLMIIENIILTEPLYKCSDCESIYDKNKNELDPKNFYKPKNKVKWHTSGMTLTKPEFLPLFHDNQK
jgi:hypothetical protein